MDLNVQFETFSQEDGYWAVAFPSRVGETLKGEVNSLKSLRPLAEITSWVTTLDLISSSES